MDKDIVLAKIFFEKILGNIESVIMVTDIKGSIVFANYTFLDFFGFSEKEIFGKKWHEKIVPEDKVPSAKKIFSEVQGKNKLYKVAIPVLGVGNMERYVSWTVIPLNGLKESLFLFVGKEDKVPVSMEAEVCKVTKEDVETAKQETIDFIVEAAKRSDPETARHASRVMYFAEALARKLKIKEERIEKLKMAALLHDLGKLMVDQRILFKKGKLTKDEFDHIKLHLDWGVEFTALFYFLKEIVPILANHHENYDGRGYPRGVRGKDISIESRILSICDIYEALTANRPYRKAFSQEEAIAIMEYEKGYKLDPRITNIFLEMVKEGKFKKFLEEKD